jgi:hypothetical protein
MCPRSRCVPALLRAGLLSGLLAGPALAQTTWHVDVHGTPPGSGTASDPFPSIQQAIAQPATVAGDTVLVRPGTYAERIDFLGKAITVVSVQGPADTVIDAGGAGSVATFASGEGPASVLDGFTLQNGAGTSAGGETRGGGLYVAGASPTLARCELTRNRAVRGGGAYLAGGAPEFVECGFSYNGPPAAASGDAWGGGAFVDASAAPTFTDTRFDLNGWAGSSALLRGGGVCGGGTFLRCTLTFNEAFEGAAVYANGGNPRFTDGYVRRNKTSGPAGACGRAAGIFGPALVEDTVFFKNRACARGGAAYQCTIRRCSFDENEVRDDAAGAGGFGGAAAECDVEDSTFLSNVARRASGHGAQGGGVWGGAVRRSRFEGNQAQRGDGGGAYGAALERCELLDNAATSLVPGTASRGGGACGGAEVRACALWGNRADRGAAVWGSQAVIDCTVVGNTSAAGGALDETGALVAGSIVRGNAPYPITSAAPHPVEFCDVDGGFPGPGNFDADPRFFGPVGHDYHLKAGSPCIDTGRPGALDPDGSPADVGAYPFDAAWCGTPHAWCAGKPNSQGCVPSVSFQGAPALSGPDDFVVNGSEFVCRQLGQLVWSRGAARAPFQGGTLCLAAPIVRTPPQAAGGSAAPALDCTGAYAFEFRHAYLAAQGLVPGTTVYAQWFARDPAQPDGTGWSLSNALEFTVCP